MTKLFHLIQCTGLNLYTSITIELKHTRLYCSNISEKSKYFKDLFETDIGGETDNVHILAKRHLASGALPTSSIINQILKLKGEHLVTDETIMEFSKILPIHISELPVNNAMARVILELSKAQGGSKYGYGVYVFTNKYTGEKYVGSSRNLLERVRQHIKGNATSMLQYQLLEHDLSSFTVDIYLLPAHTMSTERVLAFEQYMMFHINPSINKSMVANTTYHVLSSEDLAKHRLLTGVSIYVYYENKLIHKFNAVSEASSALRKDNNFVAGLLQHSNGLYRRKLLFSRLVDTSKEEELVDLETFRNIFEELTASGKNKSPITARNTKSLSAKSLADDNILMFSSVKEFFVHVGVDVTNLAKVKYERKSLNRSILKGKSFYGYLVEWLSK